MSWIARGPATSSRIPGCGRNLTAFNLPGAMDRAERVAFEKRMLAAFDALTAKFGGSINSITPEFGDGEANPNFIDDAK